MRALIPILFLCTLGFQSCQKEENQKFPSGGASTNLRPGEVFSGLYDVYDTNGSKKYSFEILVKNSIQDLPFDTLIFSNFADRFTFEKQYIATYFNDQLTLTIGVHHPILCNNGNSWHLSGLYPSFDNAFVENQLSGDTIYLYYTLSNAAFYLQDGAPYYHEEVLEMAVKQK